MSRRFDRDRLAVVVHEIRSPVAALSSIADFVSRAAGEGTNRRELARLAIAACRGIARVVGDATVASVRLEPVDVGQIAADVAAAARLAGGAVSAEIQPAIPSVEADPDRIRQALDNLVANALAYSNEGSSVVVRVGLRDGGVVVAVVDSGPGIAVADQERIFERGVRLDDSKPGAGLGLAVTRAIANAHGGVLAVDSAPGLGSTFSLVLPARH